eukprot:TRINITY_DN6287_c0_g1_i1.p1 TRINITY_DN6287_c0_g1~~TRINITY_DN6287_c0_g1_i1.p1  ORF type:complete len:148 (+),score=39.54 TRINITY_DN6287_c0_g1_i1:214-657(+)
MSSGQRNITASFQQRRKPSQVLSKPVKRLKEVSDNNVALKLDGRKEENSVAADDECCIVEEADLVSQEESPASGATDISHSTSQFDADVEEALRAWDMDMAYGPCAGVPRLKRWERAARLGLNPPESVHRLLLLHPCSSSSLWDGRL